MIKHAWTLFVAAAFAAGCATQDAPEPAPAPTSAPTPAPAPEPRAAPAPAAPAAQPAPKPAAKPTAQRVTFASDVQFDFDKAVIRPDGKSKLDDLSDKLKGIDLEVVIAIGHADQIGSPQYNQALSLRRAEAIKAYLVSKGVQPNRVYTEGKGETEPVTGDRCKGMGQQHRSNEKMVDCLAPDRRTEIEVIGTRAP